VAQAEGLVRHSREGGKAKGTGKQRSADDLLRQELIQRQARA
jgi:hypothetical protein